MFKIIIFSFCISILGCKSSYKKEFLKTCESTVLRPAININSYQELINYGKNTSREVKLIVLDYNFVDEAVLNKFIFNNSKYYLVDFRSYLDVGRTPEEGKSVRVLMLKSTLCGKLIKKNGEYIIQE